MAVRVSFRKIAAPWIAAALLSFPPSMELIAQAVAQTSPLTEQRLRELNDYADKEGVDFQFPADVLAALGLPNKAVTVRQFGVERQEAGKKVQHIFDRLPDGKGYLFARRDLEASRIYRLDPALQFISASIGTPAHPIHQAVADREKARREAQDELKSWAEVLAE
jgi:hypothetical protein